MLFHVIHRIDMVFYCRQIANMMAVFKVLTILLNVRFSKSKTLNGLTADVLQTTNTRRPGPAERPVQLVCYPHMGSRTREG